MIIDVWMQHPTPHFVRHEMFESLRRWAKGALPEGEIPLEMTAGVMDAAGVRMGLLSAWHGPRGVMISNDEVQAFVARYLEWFAGIVQGTASAGKSGESEEATA